MTFIVYEDDPDSPEGRREVMRSAAPSPTFTLPAGTYYVTARTAGAEAREQIALGAGDVVKRTLPLALAHLQLSATLDGNRRPTDLPLAFTVVRLDTEPREVVRTIDQGARARAICRALPARGGPRRHQRQGRGRDHARGRAERRRSP